MKNDQGKIPGTCLGEIEVATWGVCHLTSQVMVQGHRPEIPTHGSHGQLVKIEASSSPKFDGTVASRLIGNPVVNKNSVIHSHGP